MVATHLLGVALSEMEGGTGLVVAAREGAPEQGGREEAGRADHLEVVLRRYELLASLSRDIVLFMRRDSGRILEANSAALAAYGFSREELLSLSITDLRAPDTVPLTEGQMAIADERGVLFETIHRRKD
ncbi:MAG: PAS domain S-box protein, partial [Myxococcales bacterium]